MNEKIKILLLLLSVNLQRGKGLKQCYNLAGTAEDLVPCRPYDEVSPCCAIKERQSASDTCLEPVGWCLSPHGSIWQSGCTDKEGKDNMCPHGCPDGRTNFTQPAAADDGVWLPGMARDAWSIQLCNNGQMCCRADDSMNCCGNEALLINSSAELNFSALYPSTPYTRVLDENSGNATNTSSNQAPNSSASNGTSAPSQHPQCPALNQPLHRWLGVEVGIPLGVAFTLALFTAAILWRQKNQLEKDLVKIQRLAAVSKPNVQTGSAVRRDSILQGDSPSLAELDEIHPLVELPENARY